MTTKYIKSGFYYLFLIAVMLGNSSCLGNDSPSIYQYPDETPNPNGSEPAIMDKAINVFVPGEDGYVCYRIPTMVITNNNVILAFAEGRRNSCDDTGDIDIVMKRSTDKGRTWSKLITVKDDEENRCRNQVPVVIPETNRVVLVSCWNVGASGTAYIFVNYSDDEGVTWAAEKDITSQVKLNSFGWYATGPCHGIVKQKNPHKGRIVVPANHNLSATQEGFSHVIYSDDGGTNWSLGGIVDMVGTNESTVTELGDGSLMLNMRMTDTSRPTDQRFRIVSISNDGGETWGICNYDENLKEPMCQGAILTHSFETNNETRLLFSNPSHQTNRKNNALKLSLDSGKTWTNSAQYVGHENYGGYSDLARYSDGTIGVLYEYGYKNGSGIWFRNVQFPELQ